MMKITSFLHSNTELLMSVEMWERILKVMQVN